MSDAQHLPDARTIAHAADRLARGGLVAFPTETVYGLGADARNPQAIGAIYALKGRPSDHPVIVHLACGADLADWASQVPAIAGELARRFWPGPLTLVLRRAAGVPLAVTGGQETIGLRCPDHPVAQALLREFTRADPRRGIAAPSANRFGRISPTTARHVQDELGVELMVLEGGPARIGIESTILDLSRLDDAGPVLLRPGAIGAAELAAVLGSLPGAPDKAAPRASGLLAKHYAPRARLRLMEAAHLKQAPPDVAVWSYSVSAPSDRPLWRNAPREAVSFARELYATLRDFDDLGVAEIWLERPPAGDAWHAVNDRLVRAAAGSGAA